MASIWIEHCIALIAGGRKIGENKILTNLTSSNSSRASPYQFKCKVCKKGLVGQHIYCSACAFQEGKCSMCGKKVIDTEGHKMTLKPK